MQVRSLGWEDPLQEEMTTHSSIVAWRIPWTEEPGELQFTESQRVRPDKTEHTSTQITDNVTSIPVKWIFLSLLMKPPSTNLALDDSEAEKDEGKAHDR